MLYIFFKANSLKCRICKDAELSPNAEFFAGSCENPLDIGSHGENCKWEDNKYCLKLKITLSPDLKKKTELYERNLYDEDVLKKYFNKQEREGMQKLLAKRESNDYS